MSNHGQGAAEAVIPIASAPKLNSNEASPQTDEACIITLHSGGLARSFDAPHTTEKSRLGLSKYV